jgi:hypothetical protein
MRFKEADRLREYERFAERLLEEHLPMMGDELLNLGMDGSAIQIHGICPVYDPDTGELQNADEITAPDGGYTSKDPGETKSGHGYALFTVATATGLPLVWGITRIHDAGVKTAERLIRDHWADKIRPHVPAGKLAVLSADGGLHSQTLRAEIRRNGILEAIHYSSASGSQTSEAAIKVRDAIERDIDGYAGWTVDGQLAIASPSPPLTS